MTVTEAQVRAFFEAYEARFERALAGDDAVEETAAAFADYFVGASTAGVLGGANDEQFRAQIPMGNEFYRSIGTRRMRVRALEVQALDDRHALARVGWHSEYVRPSDGTDIAIDFEVIYLLQSREEGLRVFAYITGDEQAALREHGLLPTEPPSPAPEDTPA
jgi:hypothetical protein